MAETSIVDLRSDTVTKPTTAMRQAMANAEVGDDVFGDDPTVKALESRVAELLGKEAALYMPSGTMTNQVALRTHTEPADEIIMHRESHVYVYEAGGPAALSGCLVRLLEGPRGMFAPSTLRDALHAPGEADNHFCTQKLVVLENTHNRGGGSVWPIEQISAIELTARQAGLKLHMDGARLWNASAASGVPEAQYAKHFDSVSVCFSKGLGAPVGSALAGTREFIKRARRFRKQFGGGMRQAGIIAAGALYALENHRERLVDDHANARRLAEGIAQVPGITVGPDEVETNILYFQVAGLPVARFCAQLEQAGVLLLPSGSDTVRAVTHLQVDRPGILRAIGEIAGVMKKR